MSDDNSLGCMWVGVMVVACVVFAALLFGAPVVSSVGLSWDNSATIAREAQRTERARIQANRDVQIEEERAETARQVAGALAIVGGLAVAGWTVQRSIAAVAARPHRPAPTPPAVIVMMAAPELEAAPEAYLGYNDDDGTWAVVNPRTGSVKLLEDHGQPRRG